MQKIGRTIRRRRKENKTDYKARLGFLKSEKPRAVVRKTNRYVIGQIVVSDVAQDRIIAAAHSKELLSKGWPKELEGSLKNSAACYLTGYLLGKKMKNGKEVILDIGLQRNIKKTGIYAFLKGLVDAGVDVPHNEDSLLGEEDIKKNEKIESIFDKVKGGIK